MHVARGRRWLVGASLCVTLAAGCGEEHAKCGDGNVSCSPSAGQGGSGGAGATGGSSGAAGMAGAGGGGGGGMGGSGGMMTEPPIMGPAPTACVPMAPASTTTTKTVLYAGSEDLKGLALRRRDLFAADAMGIVRLTDGATALERVALAEVDEMLAADLRVYWTSGSALYRIDYDAMSEEPDLVASDLQVPATLLRHDETNVFYAHAATSSVWRQPIDGSAGAQLVSGAAAKDLHVHGGGVFFATGQKIQRASIETGEVTEVVAAAPRTVLDIDTDGVALVWSDGAEVFSAELEDPEMPRALTQAGPSATGMGQSRIAHLALYEQAIYFADAAGNIGTAALSGASCRILHAGEGEVRGLAVFDEHLVFANVRVGESSELWAIAH